MIISQSKKEKVQMNLTNHIYISLFVVFTNKSSITIIIAHIRVNVSDVSNLVNNLATKDNTLNRTETC